MTRLVVAAATVGMLGALMTVVPASAAPTCGTPTASVQVSQDSANSNLRCPGVPPKNHPKVPGKTQTAGKVTKPACVWVPKPDYQAGAGQPVEGKGGHWYQKFCSFGDYQTLADFQRAIAGLDAMDTQQTNMLQRAGLEVRFFTTTPPAPRRTPEQAMLEIYGRIDFPKTFLAVNPTPAKQVIGLPTWVWLTGENGRFDPKRYAVQTKELGTTEGYQLKWQIVPQVTLSPGVGEPQTCDGAGVPWSEDADQSSACTVTYNKAGRYTLTADVGWTVRWWLAGESQDPIPGPTNTATQEVTVTEIQTVTR
ncbi:hypothetical protein ACFCV3_13625 [Kribbella sp. NPDC056345]|uniref:hypothetical protein n=1 Tax=Kribbella sp. NPDC056345 TaxID=3345789 RepID=UPI0035DC1BF2